MDGAAAGAGRGLDEWLCLTGGLVADVAGWQVCGGSGGGHLEIVGLESMFSKGVST